MPHRDIDLQHGVADVFWPNSIPCNQPDPTGTGSDKVACVCDGTSYFPVMRSAQAGPSSDPCVGTPVTISHPADRVVVACSDFGNSDRFQGMDYLFSSQENHLANIHAVDAQMRRNLQHELRGAHQQESPAPPTCPIDYTAIANNLY